MSGKTRHSGRQTNCSLGGPRDTIESWVVFDVPAIRTGPALSSIRFLLMVYRPFWNRQRLPVICHEPALAAGGGIADNSTSKPLGRETGPSTNRCFFPVLTWFCHFWHFRNSNRLILDQSPGKGIITAFLGGSSFGESVSLEPQKSAFLPFQSKLGRELWPWVQILA